jgi:peptide/nickel transport system substrate-binding protein
MCLALAAASVAVAPQGETLSAGGALTVVLGSDIRTTDPGVNRDDNTDAVMSHIIETLVAYRNDLTVAPHLVESMDISSDGLTYGFRLREGLVFHDGSPVTSETVVWNWKRFLDPATNWFCRGMFDGTADSSAAGVKIAGVAARDARTVVFTLARPSALFLNLMASVQCLPGVYARSSVDARGAWVKPVGTGPFMLEEWRRGRHILLSRFPQYRPLEGAGNGLAGDRRARVERVRWIIVPEVTSAVQAFNAGQIDVLPNLSANTVGDIAKRPGVEFYPQQLFDWTVLLLQTRDPLLRDVRIRLAIAHAIDRGQIAKAATAGRGRPNPSAVPSMSAYHTPAHDGYPSYDPRRAAQLLREARYARQPLVIQTNRRFTNMYDNAVLVQAMLQQVGIQARIEVLDWATQLSNYQAGKFQLSSFSYSARSDPALAYDRLVGRKEVRATSQWESEAAEQLLATAARATDAAERARAFEQLHRLMAQDVPLIGFYNGISIHVTGPGVNGYRTWPGATPIAWGVAKR